MKPVALYFKDGVNLRAFVLVEKLPSTCINYEQSVLQSTLTEKQIAKACHMYGAALYTAPGESKPPC